MDLLVVVYFVSCIALSWFVIPGAGNSPSPVITGNGSTLILLKDDGIEDEKHRTKRYSERPEVAVWCRTYKDGCPECHSSIINSDFNKSYCQYKHVQIIMIGVTVNARTRTETYEPPKTSPIRLSAGREGISIIVQEHEHKPRADPELYKCSFYTVRSLYDISPGQLPILKQENRLLNIRTQCDCPIFSSGSGYGIIMSQESLNIGQFELGNEEKLFLVPYGELWLPTCRPSGDLAPILPVFPLWPAEPAVPYRPREDHLVPFPHHFPYSCPVCLPSYSATLDRAYCTAELALIMTHNQNIYPEEKHFPDKPWFLPTLQVFKRFSTNFDEVQVMIKQIGVEWSGNPCQEPLMRGPCNWQVHRFYYNQRAGRCQKFQYSGCFGNRNNFLSLHECQQACERPQQCYWDRYNVTGILKKTTSQRSLYQMTYFIHESCRCTPLEKVNGYHLLILPTLRTNFFPPDTVQLTSEAKLVELPFGTTQLPSISECERTRDHSIETFQTSIPECWDGPVPGDAVARAECLLRPAVPGFSDGRVDIWQAPNGSVFFWIRIAVPPEKTSFGFHVHNHSVNPDCKSAGRHYNPDENPHGKLNAERGHRGDLGNVLICTPRSVTFKLESLRLKLKGPEKIIGRSLVLHDKEDDLGLGTSESSRQHGNEGPRAACCTINSIPT